jgi:hypothetical protein
MEAMRQSWTDDRLDDLKDDLNEFRGETKSEFAAVRNEMRTEFAAVRNESGAEFRALRAEMTAGFGQINERFDRLFQAMVGLGGVMIASLVGFIATQL